MSPYRARRDDRFEYAHDVIHFIEDRQCYSCGFRNDGDDAMCHEVAIGLILEKEIDCLDDRAEDGVACLKYRDALLMVQEHPNQGRLF